MSVERLQAKMPPLEKAVEAEKAVFKALKDVFWGK